jgi:hypothetical protein
MAKRRGAAIRIPAARSRKCYYTKEFGKYQQISGKSSGMIPGGPRERFFARNKKSEKKTCFFKKPVLLYLSA